MALLRMSEVMGRVKLARSTIYKLMNEGCFPLPLKITSRTIAWQESDLDTWLEGRIAATRAMRGE